MRRTFIEIKFLIAEIVAGNNLKQEMVYKHLNTFSKSKEIQIQMGYKYIFSFNYSTCGQVFT